MSGGGFIPPMTVPETPRVINRPLVLYKPMFRHSIEKLPVDGGRIDRIAFREKNMPLLDGRDGGNIDSHLVPGPRVSHLVARSGSFRAPSVQGGGVGGVEETFAMKI